MYLCKAGLRVCSACHNSPFPRPLMMDQTGLAIQRIAYQRPCSLAAQLHTKRPLRAIPEDFPRLKRNFLQAVRRAQEHMRSIRADTHTARLSGKLQQPARSHATWSERIYHGLDIVPLHGAH